MEGRHRNSWPDLDGIGMTDHVIMNPNSAFASAQVMVPYDTYDYGIDPALSISKESLQDFTPKFPSASNATTQMSTLGSDNRSFVQSSATDVHEPNNHNHYPLGALENERDTVRHSDPMPSSSVTLSNFFGPSTFLSNSRPSSDCFATRSPRKRLNSQKTKIHCSRRHLPFSDNPIKQRKARAGMAPNAQLRNITAQLETVGRSNPKFSKMVGQCFEILLAQAKVVEQLMDAEVSQANIDDESVAISNPQDARPTSEITDSGYRSKDDDSLSSTPRQPGENHEAMSMDIEPEELQSGDHVQYHCTWKDCAFCSYNASAWKRHEQGLKHFQQKRFMCLQCPIERAAKDEDDNDICEFCNYSFISLEERKPHYLHCPSARKDGKTYGRKDHLCSHLKSRHRLDKMSSITNSWDYCVQSDWPRQCGFCGVSFGSWDERMEHIGNHYLGGSKIADWRLPFPRPKFTKPTRTYPKPPENDDDEDDDSNHHGGSSKRRALGYGMMTFTPQNTYFGQSNPSQGPTSVSQQGYYQLCYNHRGLQSTGLGPKPVKLSVPSSLALERYLNDTEDQILGLCARKSTAALFPKLLSLRDSFNSPLNLSEDISHPTVIATEDRSVVKKLCLQNEVMFQLILHHIRRQLATPKGGIFWSHHLIVDEINNSLWNIPGQIQLCVPRSWVLGNLNQSKLRDMFSSQYFYHKTKENCDQMRHWKDDTFDPKGFCYASSGDSDTPPSHPSLSNCDIEDDLPIEVLLASLNKKGRIKSISLEPLTVRRRTFADAQNLACSPDSRTFAVLDSTGFIIFLEMEKLRMIY